MDMAFDSVSYRVDARDAEIKALREACSLILRERDAARSQLGAFREQHYIDLRGWLKLEARHKDLLARIHHDGGHYAEKHGLEKAAKDADEIICQLQSAAMNAPTIAKFWRTLLLRAYVAQFIREGWEESETAAEAWQAVIGALFNAGLDPGVPSHKAASPRQSSHPSWHCVHMGAWKWKEPVSGASSTSARRCQSPTAKTTR